MIRFGSKLLSVAALFFAVEMPSSAQVSQGANLEDIVVSAKKSGDMVIIDVSMLVPATQRETWDVLIDFDRMPQFLPNLQASKILSKSPTRLQVAQKGGVSHGPISITFDVVRDVELKPYTEIRSHVVSGNLKKVDGTTRLAAEGEGTRVTLHTESIPNVWVPPGIGPTLIENETRDQFRDMRNEILKRKEAAKK